MVNQKFKVLFLTTRARELFPQSLVTIANVTALDVTDVAAAPILHNIAPDWIICCSVPVEHRIAPILAMLKAKGLPILGLGPTHTDMVDVVLSKFTPIHSMRSACHLLIMLSQTKAETKVKEEFPPLDLKDLIEILERAVNLRVPGSHERAIRIEALAEQVGRHLRLSKQELDDLMIAARLREIGKIGVPDELLYTDLSEMPPERIRIYENYAALGAVILRTLPSLEGVALCVGYQLENVDGTGPSGAMMNKIPIGARILRACIAFERLDAAEGTERAADNLTQLWSKANTHFDPNVLAALDATVSQREFKPDADSSLIPVDALRAGMQLGQSLYDSNGFRMLAYGAEISAAKIDAIVSYLKLTGQREIAVITESVGKPHSIE
ncbi:hypothetical protein HUU59_12420 [bacterium]|nr:hypothetical protein [bacterium]